jgi:hypothetical protein
MSDAFGGFHRVFTLQQVAILSMGSYTDIYDFVLISLQFLILYERLLLSP